MNDNSQKRSIFGTLDGIRGVAALLVLMRHVPFFGPFVFQETYLAVDLFFILSGVVIANAYEDRLLNGLTAKQFAWMRIVRIYPLYLLGCAVAGVCWLVAGKTEEGNSAVIAISALLLLPNVSSFKSFPLNGPAWSLFSEMLANILYGCFVRRLSLKVLLAIIGISGVGIFGILLRNHNLDFGYYTKDIIPGLFRVGYSFFAGVLIYRIFSSGKFQHKLNESVAKYIPWLLLLAVGLLLTASPYGILHALFDLVAVTVIFPVIIFAALIFSPGTNSTPVFKFLGLISYPLYALHLPLSKWIPVIFRDTNVDLLSRPLWIGLLFTAILIPLCWLLDKYYDMPIRKFALKLGFSYLKKSERDIKLAPTGK